MSSSLSPRSKRINSKNTHSLTASGRACSVELALIDVRRDAVYLFSQALLYGDSPVPASKKLALLCQVPSAVRVGSSQTRVPVDNPGVVC